MKCELRLEDYVWDLDIPPNPRIGFVWPSLYICPHCCEAWAQIWVKGIWNPTILEIPCLECARPFRAQVIPGSLIYQNASSGALDLELLSALPRELLDRELNLHISVWEQHERSDINRISGYLLGTITPCGS